MAGDELVHIPGYDGFVEIGRGGFAVVYRARQTRLRRLVAVKVLNGGDPSPVALARFEHECAAIGALSGHRNVVAVHDAGTTDDGRPYLAMEYLPGGSLAERLDRGALPVDEALSIGAQLADALSAAHAAEVLHRDVKPENVLLGDDGTPKLADFGIAVVADAHQTATGVVIGTVLHSAPEVLTGERATVSADVYSLASTIFTLIHGTPAFAGAHDEGPAPTMYRVVHAPVPDLRPTGVPGPAASLLETGMAKDPTERFRSTAAFRRAIEGTAEVLGSTVAAPAVVPLGAPTLPPARDVARHPPSPGGASPPPGPGWSPPPLPSAAAGPPGHPPDRSRPRGRAGVVLGVVAALLVLAAVVGGIVAVQGGDDDATTDRSTTTASARGGASSTDATEPSTTSSSTVSSTARPSPSSTTTSTTTPTTTTSPSSTTTTTTTSTTTTPTTTTLPPAATVADATAQVVDRYPGTSVVDDSGFRLGGASVLIGSDPDGRMRAFLFGDGRLLGTDTSDPSTAVSLVSISGDVVVLRYDLWAAGVGPPDPPAGASEVTLTWDGGDAFVPAGEFPSSDISVDGHR